VRTGEALSLSSFLFLFPLGPPWLALVSPFLSMGDCYGSWSHCIKCYSVGGSILETILGQLRGGGGFVIPVQFSRCNTTTYICHESCRGVIHSSRQEVPENSTASLEWVLGAHGLSTICLFRSLCPGKSCPLSALFLHHHRTNRAIPLSRHCQ